MSTSNVTDMLVETDTFSSFCAGEVESMWGVWAEAGTAAQNHTLWGATNRRKHRTLRVFLYMLNLRRIKVSG